MNKIIKKGKTYKKANIELSFYHFINDIIGEPSYNYYFKLGKCLDGSIKLRFIHVKWLKNYSIVKLKRMYSCELYLSPRR